MNSNSLTEMPEAKTSWNSTGGLVVLKALGGLAYCTQPGGEEVLGHLATRMDAGVVDVNGAVQLLVRQGYHDSPQELSLRIDVVDHSY